MLAHRDVAREDGNIPQNIPPGRKHCKHDLFLDRWNGKIEGRCNVFRFLSDGEEYGGAFFKGRRGASCLHCKVDERPVSTTLTT